MESGLTSATMYQSEDLECVIMEVTTAVESAFLTQLDETKSILPDTYPFYCLKPLFLTYPYPLVLFLWTEVPP